MYDCPEFSGFFNSSVLRQVESVCLVFPFEVDSTRTRIGWVVCYSFAQVTIFCIVLNSRESTSAPPNSKIGSALIITQTSLSEEL